MIDLILNFSILTHISIFLEMLEWILVYSLKFIKVRMIK